MMNIVNRFAYCLFGSYAYRNKNVELQTRLRQAHIHIPVDIYQSIMLLYSTIAAVIFGIGAKGAIVFVYPHMPYINIQGLNPYKDSIFVLLSIGIMMVMVFWSVKSLFSAYPVMKTSIRASRIDQTLVYATTYMYAMSRGGMNLFMVFKSVSENSHIYGDAAKEISYIVRDMEFFDKDILEALTSSGNRTTSRQYRDFVNGLVTVMNSGGDITSYFEAKSTQYRALIEQEQKVYLESIGLIAEAYITAFVVGPLLLITIVVVLGFIDPTAVSLLQIVIYGLVPVSSLFCIILIDIVTGSREDAYDVYDMSEKLEVYGDIPEKTVEQGSEGNLFTAFFLNTRASYFLNILKNPITHLIANPKLTFIISVPYAILYLSGVINSKAINANSLEAAFASIDNNIVFALFIVFLPFVIFYETRMRWIRKMESRIPEFLDGLATINESGLNLTDAIGVVVKSKLGLLTSEIRRVWMDIRWGNATSIALYKFETRVNTPLISRTTTLIIKANEAISDIRSVLRIAAMDADMAIRIKNERLNNMLMYVIVVYISFFVFLLIAYVLSTIFLDSMPAPVDTSDISGFTIGFLSFDKEQYIQLLYHATLIQGFFSGLVTGQLGEGNVYSGLKHSLIMIFIGYLVFNVLM